MAQPRPLPEPDWGRPSAPRRRGRRWFPRVHLRAPRSRGARYTLIGLGILIALIVIASFFVDEPLRRTIESQMNARMKGYTAHIERLRFHPLGFGVTLYNTTLSQDAHPDPPVLDVERLDASVEWKALLHARLVANFRFQEPKLHVDIVHLREEAKDPTPLQEHGWQDALEAIYPLKIDELRIVDGQAVYIEKGAAPLRVTNIDAIASNIRNVHSRDRDYPSAIQASAVVFESGRLSIDGHADFLKEPFLGVKGNISLQKVPLDYFRPVAERYHVTMKGGTLSADGLVEYAPTIKVVDLRDAEVHGIKIDYIHTPKNVGIAQKTAQTTVQTARQTGDRADLLVRAKHVRLSDSEVGIVDKSKDPGFRVFLSAVNLDIQNVTNQKAEGIGRINLTGRFMGSGQTTATMTIPNPKGPDFDFALKIEGTDMPAMNPLLRQYGKFDVVAGEFSLYSEMRGRNGAVTGYVKPIFKDVKAYDPGQDRDKGFAKRLYERLVTGVAKLLKNPPHDQVATKVDVAGRLDQPQTSTLQAIGNLLRNAFIKAILPGLERETSAAR